MQRCPKRIQHQSDKLNTVNLDKKFTYISMKEAASVLHLDTSTIRYHIIRRRIRAFKASSKWWLHRDDVETFCKWNK